jgi:hypothetical protein
MAEFIPDLVMCWASYEQLGSLSEIKHQQETVCRTLGENFKVGKENQESISFWDNQLGITVLYAKDHAIASMQLPEEKDVKEKWQAFTAAFDKALSLSSVPETFTSFTCNARTFYSTSKDVDESADQVEKIFTMLSHGRKIYDLLDTQVIDRQGVNEVQYRTVQNTQNQLYGMSLIYSRASALDTRLTKEGISTFLHEENVPEQMQEEQKRLDELAQKAIIPLEEATEAPS